MKYRRIDLGLTANRRFYRTRFSSVGPELVDIDVDVERALDDRDPELRGRQESLALKEHGIPEEDVIA